MTNEKIEMISAKEKIEMYSAAEEVGYHQRRESYLYRVIEQDRCGFTRDIIFIYDPFCWWMHQDVKDGRYYSPLGVVASLVKDNTLPFDFLYRGITCGWCVDRLSEDDMITKGAMFIRVNSMERLDDDWLPF